MDERADSLSDTEALIASATLSRANNEFAIDLQARSEALCTG